jgi:hypothetical protein
MDFDLKNKELLCLMTTEMTLNYSGISENNLFYNKLKDILKEAYFSIEHKTLNNIIEKNCY